MDDNDKIDPAIATEGIPRRRPWRMLLLSGAALTALLLLLGFFLRDRLFSCGRAEDDLGNGFPTSVLADYVPEDSEAVLAVHVDQLRESPMGRRHLAPILHHLIRQAGGRLRWMDLLGIKPFEDLDYIQISFAPAVGGQPLWLVRGRLDRSRIQIGPDKLQETSLDRFRVWQCTDREVKQTTLLATVGDMLVVSESRGRLLAALKQASDPRPIAVRDATLREMLAAVDRQQALWLAASIKGLGSIAAVEDYMVKLVLSPLLAHAESVHGGLTCAEDVRIELHLRSATAEDAASLERALQSRCEAAPGAALWLGRNKAFLPLLRLLGSGKISREGNSVLLRCRLAAEELDG
ncbi:MAG TPA: hypothetical protein VMG10_16605 [Gemmataceae bacterium]|nr:hypothetical protein [Gemmataceae bacterium]